MLRHLPRRLLALAGTTAAVVPLVLGPAPAHAIHLFPLTPTFDPLGHDCAKNLTAAPPAPNARVTVVGFNFVDSVSHTSATTIHAGQQVAWTWLLDHCHSVTFDNPAVTSTFGAPGFLPAGQPQLVRLNGAGNDTFAVTFSTPGDYTYHCVHHASVGMTGTITVTP